MKTVTIYVDVKIEVPVSENYNQEELEEHVDYVVSNTNYEFLDDNGDPLNTEIMGHRISII